MTDHLAEVFNHYAINARVFFSGNLCSNVEFDDGSNIGHLHFLRRGIVTVRSYDHETLTIVEPSLLLYPRCTKHSFEVDKTLGADLVCARVEFGATSGNALAKSLPEILVIPLKDLPMLSVTLELLFNEAFTENDGRQAAIDRVCELLLIQLFRYAIKYQLTSSGLLSGLSDKRLCKAISAIHKEPAYEWTLDSLAETAGMSRARFAVHFKEKVGTTPGGYLTEWRIGLAQVLLKKGKPVGLIANEVGYSGATALSRAFKAHTKLTPKEWLHGQNTPEGID